MSSSIQSKTVRPGGLRYSYYSTGVGKQPKAKKQAPPKKSHFKGVLLILILIIAAPLAYAAATTPNKSLRSASNSIKPTTISTAPVNKPSTPAPAVATTPSVCANNQVAKIVIVSISKQHLWVCDGATQEFDSAVVTGDEQHADTLTPTGTYHIYAMQTDRTLTGSDENGSWNDYVNYWMPFLYNQYGAYGFHDATWRTPTEFGNVDINSANASNGCVELPLASAKWIYNWASVGTTVQINS
ncbi:MAG TPA: L,D-transpeptidase [Candidatus Saccharimonadales bacterium]|nr:L,D-transpeptidase [Candidatus Saccharimonadales bacterium]